MYMDGSQWRIQDTGLPIGGCGPPMRVLFGENVCKNERIGSHRGWHLPSRPPIFTNGSYLLANTFDSSLQTLTTKACNKTMKTYPGWPHSGLD